MPSWVNNGATIAFDCSGTGPPVLLIQGVGVIGRGWQPQVDGLAGEYSLYTFDNRGIGQSSLGDGALSIEAMAADAIAVMDAAGAARFHVVGHSMDGVIAQEVALRAPARVRSLCLMCTVERGRDASGMTLPMIKCRAQIALVGTRSVTFRFLKLATTPISDTNGINSSQLGRIKVASPAATPAANDQPMIPL